MKYVITILLLFAGTALFSADTISLTFQEALAEMQKSNESLKAVKMEQEKAAYEKKAAAGLYFPQVDIMFFYTHLNRPVEMDFNPLKNAMVGLAGSAYGAATNTGSAGAAAFAQQAMSNPAMADNNFIQTLQKQDFWAAGATVRQPVFTGGKITAANKAAAARKKISGEKLHYTENYLVTELTERYFGCSLALEVIKVRKQVLEGMQKHNRDAESLYKTGMIARAEFMQSEVSLAEADRELKKAIRDADTASAGLMNTLSTGNRIYPVTPLFYLKEVKDLDFYKKQAASDNPGLRQAEANRQLAHQAYKGHMAEMYPDVFLFGTMKLADQNLSSYVPDWFAGAGASYTLFNGFGSYHSIKAASAQEKQVEAVVIKARRDISTLVEKNYNELMKDKEQIESLDTSLSFAEEFLRVRETAFREGFGSSADVVDAQMNLSKIRIEKLQAMYSFDVSLARLLEACGGSRSFCTYMNSGIQKVSDR